MQAIAVAVEHNCPMFVNAGRISKRQSAIYATAQWANHMERKLLGLPCGQALERSRHVAWAERVVGKSKFLMQPGGHFGVVVLPRTSNTSQGNRHGE